MSDAVDFGSDCLSGAWRPQSLTGLRPMSQRMSAYAAQTPSCIVDTVMVMPAVLPPTASSAPLLYSLYFVLPAYLGVGVCRAARKGGPRLGRRARRRSLRRPLA